MPGGIWKYKGENPALSNEVWRQWVGFVRAVEGWPKNVRNMQPGSTWKREANGKGAIKKTFRVFRARAAKCTIIIVLSGKHSGERSVVAIKRSGHIQPMNLAYVSLVFLLWKDNSPEECQRLLDSRGDSVGALLVVTEEDVKTWEKWKKFNHRNVTRVRIHPLQTEHIPTQGDPTPAAGFLSKKRRRTQVHEFESRGVELFFLEELLLVPSIQHCPNLLFIRQRIISWLILSKVKINLAFVSQFQK